MGEEEKNNWGCGTSYIYLTRELKKKDDMKLRSSPLDPTRRHFFLLVNNKWWLALVRTSTMPQTTMAPTLGPAQPIMSAVVADAHIPGLCVWWSISPGFFGWTDADEWPTTVVLHVVIFNSKEGTDE